MMELWASGFNAWGQLDFEEVPETFPHDLKEFRRVMTGERIEVVRSSLSATLVKTSTSLHTAGCSDDLIEHCISNQNSLPILAIAGNDKVVSQVSFPNDSAIGNIGRPDTLVQTDANTSILKQYDSFDSYIKNNGEELPHIGEIKQVVANQSTFTALSNAGEVWTWGDGRYEACLGREVSDEKPALEPCIVEDLLDLPTGPIWKIASGGYVTAVLTEGNDLYVWGGRPGQPNLLQDLTGEPTPVDVEGEDVLDVAVGMNHMLALTRERKLFVVGENSNGQLGLIEEELAAWKEVDLPLKDNHRIVSVHVGYKNSLVVVEEIT